MEVCKVFLKKFVCKLWGFCVLGFVTGIFFALIMPPVVIVVVQGALLALLCLAIFL